MFLLFMKKREEGKGVLIQDERVLDLMASKGVLIGGGGVVFFMAWALIC